MKTELVLEIIKERWSPYAFSSTPVEEYKLKAMMEAAGNAPSSRNEQPWLFVYSTQNDRQVFDDYLDFLFESNQEWARHAYALIISMARTKYSKNGKPNRYAFHDTGMAVANLLIQALSMDVYVHQMGGFSVQKVNEYFNLKNDIEPIAIMAVGYLGDGVSLSPEILIKDEKRRKKRSVNEFAFKNSISNPAF